MCEPVQSVLDRHGVTVQLRGTPGDGWANLIDRLVTELVALGWEKRLGQVKEKFGGLRFYSNSPCTPEMAARIDAAVEEAGRTCEFCGEPGQRRAKPLEWVKTSCTPCHVARVEERKKQWGTDPWKEWKKRHGKDDSRAGEDPED